jgi:hypothetical protein
VVQVEDAIGEKEGNALAWKALFVGRKMEGGPTKMKTRATPGCQGGKWEQPQWERTRKKERGLFKVEEEKARRHNVRAERGLSRFVILVAPGHSFSHNSR